MREENIILNDKLSMVLYSKNIMWLGFHAILYCFVDSTEISKKETIIAMKKAQKLLLASVTHEF